MDELSLSLNVFHLICYQCLQYTRLYRLIEQYLFVKLKQYFIRITAEIRIGLFENVNLKKKRKKKQTQICSDGLVKVANLLQMKVIQLLLSHFLKS